MCFEKDARMIMIFGCMGYMGSAIAAECDRRGLEWCPGFRGTFDDVMDRIIAIKPELLVNAAAYIPSPTVDACKDNKAKTVDGNVMWPTTLAHVCASTVLPLMHLSTGCLFDEQREYTEEDTPTRGWDGYCGFYVGTKLMAETNVSFHAHHYILRLRLPFDEVDHPRNFISKMLAFENVYDIFNSLTHRGDFAKAVLDMWAMRVPFGTYNMTNNGGIASRMLIHKMREAGLPVKDPQFTHKEGVTGCKLSIKKLLSTGVKMRWVGDALEESLTQWKLR